MNERTAGASAQRLKWIFCALLIVETPALVFGQAPPVQVIPSEQTGPPIAVLSLAELDSLVAPIALYPDPLLSQLLVAATYPLEIVEAAQWLRRNPSLTGAALQDAARQQDWDPSIQALLVFPDVLGQLSENIQWTTDLGNSFLAQEAGVMDAVQRMRSRAMASGNLSTNAQTVVTTQPQGPTTIVEIHPANPQVIYVPDYDPVAIWGPPAFYAYPAFYYPRRAVFLNVGPIFNGWSGWSGWGWRPNWHGRTIIVNNNFFNRYGYNRIAIAGGRRWDGPSVWRHEPRLRWNNAYTNRDLDSRFRNEPRNDVRRTPVRRPSETVRAFQPRPGVVNAGPPSAARGFAPRATPGIDSRPARRSVTPTPSPMPNISRPTARVFNSPGPATRVSPPRIARDVPRGTARAFNQEPARPRGEARRNDGASRPSDRDQRRARNR